MATRRSGRHGGRGDGEARRHLTGRLPRRWRRSGYGGLRAADRDADATRRCGARQRAGARGGGPPHHRGRAQPERRHGRWWRHHREGGHFVLPLYDARRSTAVDTATADVVTANDAATSPAPMVTPAGILAAAGFVLASVTTAPPADAGPLSVTVPVADWPPATVAGLTPSELSDTTGSAPGCQPSRTTSKSLAVRAPNAGLRMSVVPGACRRCR